MCCCVSYPHAHFCVIVCFLNFPQVGEENVEVHVDLNQGSCAVDGRGSVDASVSVVVDCADPSVAQASHDAVPTSRHQDSDVGIEKPLENVAPAASVVASPVCLVSNDVPEVSRVEPHVVEVSKDVAIDQTVVNPQNADVAAEGQSSEVVVDSSQPIQENVLVSSEEQQHEDSDTEGKSFVSNSTVEVLLISFCIITMVSVLDV